MKRKKFLISAASIALSIFITENTTFAEEATVPAPDTSIPGATVDPSVPVSPDLNNPGTSPTTPPVTDPNTNPDVPPTDTTVPSTDPSTPATDPTVPSTDPSTPATDPTVPSTDNQPKDNSEGTVSPNISPTTTPKPVYYPNTPSVGTVSTATGQVVENVSRNQPIITNNGFEILSTDQGRFIVKTKSGESMVSAEKVGGKVNDDGTLTVKDSSGKTRTLPNTGDAVSLMTTIGLLFLAIIGLRLKPIESEENWFTK